MDDLKILRLTGLAGVAGALLMFSGDMFLYGGFYGGAEFREISRRIMSEIPLLRLMIGGAIGPVAAMLYTIGFWHVYLALKEGGKKIAKIVFSGFVSMIIIGGAYHSGFVNIGLVLRAKNSVNETDLKIIKTLFIQVLDYLHLLYNISFVFGLVGTILFLYLILFKKTKYPKWIILLTPTLLLLTSHIATYLPAPVGGIIYGGYINLSFLLFFCVSIIILWNGGSKTKF